MFVCGCWFFGVSMMTLMIVSVVHKYIKLIIWQMHESLIGINEKLWYEKKKKKKSLRLHGTCETHVMRLVLIMKVYEFN